MSEREPQVTFTDRRKISSDGEIRPEAAQNEAREQQERQIQTPQPTPASTAEGTDAAKSSPEGGPAPAADEESAAGALPEGPTAQESAESNAAYQQTTQQLDDLLRAKAPDSSHLGPVVFDHLVQSMYMTAMMSMGAGTQPGEKPRIDLMGARQTIDLLSVLAEKTKGNLTLDEQRLLESALFELRMMFLEITNAIARNASNPSQQKPSGRK